LVSPAFNALYTARTASPGEAKVFSFADCASEPDDENRNTRRARLIVAHRKRPRREAGFLERCDDIFTRFLLPKHFV
jgi:hypothetical protein